jgi:CheY-like chemotaxis protein
MPIGRQLVFKFLKPVPMFFCAGEQARMNVLIVEDSRFLRVSNERALQHAGYNVITAADGEEGLRLALERKPDLVVLDLMLPKLPGYEVLRELRKHRETAKILVMVVSSLPQSNGPLNQLKQFTAMLVIDSLLSP